MCQFFLHITNFRALNFTLGTRKIYPTQQYDCKGWESATNTDISWIEREIQSAGGLYGSPCEEVIEI